jgi:phenylpyruvate tautomerase PptA (4-oxalocrotonate tautomerase family)
MNFTIKGSTMLSVAESLLDGGPAHPEYKRALLEMVARCAATALNVDAQSIVVTLDETGTCIDLP